MELKEFIKSVLIEIIDGIELAQQEVIQTKREVIINPTLEESIVQIGAKKHLPTQNSVRITATISVIKNKKGGFGLNVIPAKIETGSTLENGFTHEVCFDIPLSLPSAFRFEQHEGFR